MLLAGKTACAGMVFLLLATGISAPRPTPLTSGVGLSNEVPVSHPNYVEKMQQILQEKGHYRGKVDGALGLRTRASIRAYQKAESLPVTGQLDVQTAGKLGVTREVRQPTPDEAPKNKPSAGIKSARGSRRTNRTPQKAAKTATAAESTRKGTGKTYAENKKNDR